VICQPRGHVLDAACADCGDGPLITGSVPTSAATAPGRRWTGYACTAGKPIRPAMPCSRPLISDRALVCGWWQLPYS